MVQRETRPNGSKWSGAYDALVKALYLNNSPTANRANDSQYRMKSSTGIHKSQQPVHQMERLVYSLHEAADMLEVDYLTVYRLVNAANSKHAAFCVASS